jgi:oxygen-independent coproporphyrinogen-3 oxidase
MRFLYVHIPFCVEKCHYCDFVSYDASLEQRETYLQSLIKEAALHREDKPEDGLLTIYFGGGTPSLLTAAHLEMLLEAFQRNFGFAKRMEITLEANPETVSLRYLKNIRGLDINRLSLGGQAFQDHHLKAMGRIHKSEDITAAVEMAREAGFDNINVDLMYGLPHQTMAEWQESLERATQLPITHISTYGLKLSPATLWGRWQEEGKLTLPEDDLNADMQLYAMEYLEKAGFPRYEIANFAKGSYACRHNTAYWLRKDYLGLGLNASSLLYGNLRTKNEKDFEKYRSKVAGREYPWAEKEVLSDEQIREEELFLPLRLIWGLDTAAFAEKYGVEYFTQKKGQMVKLFDAGLLTVEEGQLKLTDKGVLLNNEVLAALI